jgi:hypothetical protein
MTIKMNLEHNIKHDIFYCINGTGIYVITMNYDGWMNTDPLIMSQSEQK